MTQAVTIYREEVKSRLAWQFILNSAALMISLRVMGEAMCRSGVALEQLGRSMRAISKAAAAR